MNAKKDLYLAVKGRVLNNACINHFLLFNSQFDEIEQEQLFQFPSVFMEFIEIGYESEAKGGQKANMSIRLHVAFESVATEDLEIFDVIDSVHQSLQGFSAKDSDFDFFTPLNRVSEAQDTNHDNITIWTMDYDTVMYDYSGHESNKLVKTTLSGLDVSLETDVEGYKPRLPHLPK